MSSDQESRSNPTEYAKAALQMMEKKGIPPKPNNFAVWYRYFSGAYPELSRTLDVILEAGLPFTEERNAEIYDRFLGVTLDEDFLNDATLRVETELKKLMSYLEEAGDDAIVVMGASMRSDLSKRLLGGVSMSVLENSKASVLLAKAMPADELTWGE